MNAFNTTNIQYLQTHWLRSLGFYTQELEILKERLPAIAKNHENAKMAEELAYFQDQFYVQLHNIARLQHGISDNISTLSDEAKLSENGEVEDTDSYDYCNLKGKLEAQEEIIRLLRLRFNKFCAKWM